MGVNGEPISLALTLAFLLGCGKRAQLVIPLRLERLGNEAIRGVDLHVTMPRLVGLVLRTFDLTVPQPVFFIEASGDLLLDRECQLPTPLASPLR